MSPGRDAICFTASTTPGMNDDAVVGVVADRERLPGRAQQHLLVGHQPAQPHRVHPDAGRPDAAARARPRPRGGWDRAPTSATPPAMRCTVIMAVPDGASTLASWCSSITSAVSKYGAASSAKRIISTAPMAKFGATRQLLG